MALFCIVHSESLYDLEVNGKDIYYQLFPSAQTIMIACAFDEIHYFINLKNFMHMTKKVFVAFVATFAFALACNAQSEKKSSKNGTVLTQSQISFEDKEAWLEGRSDKTYSDLQIHNMDGKKAHYVFVGLGAGTLLANGLKPYAELLGGYETRHFVFEGFIGGALNELPATATVNPGKKYLGLIAGGEVDLKLLSDVNRVKWLGFYGRVNGAWFKTDDQSADYSSSGSGTEFGAGIVWNIPISSVFLRAKAGVATKIEVDHNGTQWDHMNPHPDLSVSLVVPFNK